MVPPPVWPVVLAGFAAFTNLYATQPLLPLLMRTFDASHFAVSLSITAPTLAVAAAAPIAGRVADMVGRKRVIVSAAALMSLATVLAATSHNLTQFIAWRFVQGLLTPGIFAITIAYIHEEYPSSFTGRATAAYVSGTVVGGFCGRALVGLVAADASWKVAFVTLGAVNVATAVAIALWLPRERHAWVHVPGGHSRSVLALLRNGQLMATNAVGFCVLFSQVAVFTYVTFHLEAPPYALSTAALGSLFVVYLFGAAVTPLAGRWVDAHGHRAGLGLGMTIGGVGAAMTLATPLWLIVIGLALVGTGVFVGQTAASSYISRATTSDRGLAVGLYSSSYYLGGSLGGALPALLWSRGAWLGCVLLVIAVQTATLALALLFWPRAQAA